MNVTLMTVQTTYLNDRWYTVDWGRDSRKTVLQSAADTRLEAARAAAFGV